MDQNLIDQLVRLYKEEQKFLNQRENDFFKTKVYSIKKTIQGKIPDELKDTLEAAFFKGFQLVFEKGHGYIEKTYNKDKLQLEYDLNNLALDKEFSNKHINRLDKQANNCKTVNTLISVVEGSVLGLLGIGLPDIPLFIAIIIKTISQVALSYGYDYLSCREKGYVLLLISGAMSKGEKQKEFSEAIDRLGKMIDLNIDTEIYLEKLMKETASVLSDVLLTAKFIQGIPIVGVVGGMVNYNIIKRIGKFSGLKYKKRYLLRKAGRDL